MERAGTMKACLGSKNRELAGVCGSPYENWDEMEIIMEIVNSHPPSWRKPFKEDRRPTGRGKVQLTAIVKGGNGTGYEQIPVRKRRQLLTFFLTLCVPFCRSHCPSRRYVSLQCSRKLFLILECGLWGWDEMLSKELGPVPCHS